MEVLELLLEFLTRSPTGEFSSTDPRPAVTVRTGGWMFLASTLILIWLRVLSLQDQLELPGHLPVGRPDLPDIFTF